MTGYRLGILHVGIVAAALLFFVFVHAAIAADWAVIGTVPGATRLLWLDAIACIFWLGMIWLLWVRARYRGDFLLLVLPVAIWLTTRPFQFGLMTSPLSASQQSSTRSAATAAEGSAPTTTRADAVDVVAERLRLHQLLQDLPDTGAVPAIREAARSSNLSDANAPKPVTARQMLSTLPVVAAPLALLLGFHFARAGGLRQVRRLRWILLSLAVVGGIMARVASQRVIAGFTPLELVLPVAAATVAAFLAEGVSDIRLGLGTALRADGIPFAAIALLGVPFFPLTIVGGPHVAEVGVLAVLLSAAVTAAVTVVLRRWFLLSVVGLCIGLVALAFTLSDRPRERWENAIRPYPSLSSLSPESQVKVARRNAQTRMSDAALLDGGVWGLGPGRGSAVLVPRPADDTFFASFAADWGLVGTTFVVCLYAVLLVRIAVLATLQDHALERAVVAAFGAILAAPLFLSFLGSVRALPLTGVPVAFATQGGAKTLAAAFAQGMLAYISHATSLVAADDRI